jgi:hypothetical protein
VDSMDFVCGGCFSLLHLAPWVGDDSGDPIEPSLEEEGSLYSTVRLVRPERLGAGG